MTRPGQRGQKLPCLLDPLGHGDHMFLNQQKRTDKALGAIWRNLVATDPGLAELLDSFPGGRGPVPGLVPENRALMARGRWRGGAWELLPNTFFFAALICAAAAGITALVMMASSAPACGPARQPFASGVLISGPRSCTLTGDSNAEPAAGMAGRQPALTFTYACGCH
jgi:hypothetical protein